MEIGIAGKDDLAGLLSLYTHLNKNNNGMPVIDADLSALWDRILSDEDCTIIVGKLGDAIVSSCTLIIVPNLTHGGKPYALVENVVTDGAHRNKGYATAVLNHARQIATDSGCYKIMLLTGSKQESTLNFYRKAGYNSENKTGFIQWL